jgi:hypothetical protein
MGRVLCFLLLFLGLVGNCVFVSASSLCCWLVVASVSQAEGGRQGWLLIANFQSKKMQGTPLISTSS